MQLEFMSTCDCLYSFNLCLMGLGCPLLRGSSYRRLRKCVATLPPLLERTFPGSILFSGSAEVMAAVRDLEEGNISFGVRTWVKCVVVSGCVRRLPAIEGAYIHWGRRFWGRFWRLRWFRAIIVIVGIFGIICYCHRCQDFRRVGRQVQVVQAWGNNWKLPSKTVWHCGLIRVVIDCHNLWFRRCNWCYRDHFSGIVTWHLCGIANNRRIGSGYALVIGWLFHIKNIRVSWIQWWIRCHLEGCKLWKSSYLIEATHLNRWRLVEWSVLRVMRIHFPEAGFRLMFPRRCSASLNVGSQVDEM